MLSSPHPCPFLSNDASPQFSRSPGTFAIKWHHLMCRVMCLALLVVTVTAAEIGAVKHPLVSGSVSATPFLALHPCCVVSCVGIASNGYRLDVYMSTAQTTQKNWRMQRNTKFIKYAVVPHCAASLNIVHKSVHLHLISCASTCSVVSVARCAVWVLR